MRGFILLVALSILTTGCGLIPKTVEFGQRKVKGIPPKTTAQLEAEREAAKYAADQSLETLVAASHEGASTNVLTPARKTLVVTSALSSSLGAPASPWKGEADALARRLGTMEARLDAAVESMRKRQAQDVGKKIEGTGWLQVPYLLWVGIVVGGGFLVWTVLKIVGTIYPPVGLGVSGLSFAGRASASVVQTALHQVVRGGEWFKDKLSTVELTPEQRAAVLDLFRTQQQSSQDEQVQELLKKLTR